MGTIAKPIFMIRAVMAGAEGWAEIVGFSEVYKPKLNGVLPRFKETPVPSHDTFRRVLGLLEPTQLQNAVAVFMLDEVSQIKNTLGIVDNGPRLICVDGKEQKGTGRKYNKTRKSATFRHFTAMTPQTGYVWIGWDLIRELTVLLSILDEEVLADALFKSVIKAKK